MAIATLDSPAIPQNQEHTVLADRLPCLICPGGGGGLCMTVVIGDVGKKTDTTCEGGFPGIQSNSICCALACGQCGGAGCSSAGGLTAEECCTKNIAVADVPCTIAGEGPCVLGGELFFGLVL